MNPHPGATHGRNTAKYKFGASHWVRRTNGVAAGRDQHVHRYYAHRVVVGWLLGCPSGHWPTPHWSWLTFVAGQTQFRGGRDRHRLRPCTATCGWQKGFKKTARHCPD